MGVSGRTKTAHQLLQALAGLAQGVSSGLVKGWEIQSDQEKEDWNRKFKLRQQQSIEDDRKDRNEDRDAARGLREKAMLGKGTSSDFMKFVLGMKDTDKLSEANISKGRIAAIQRYHDMREAGADKDRSSAEMGNLPSEEKIPVTSALAAVLFPDKKPDKGFISVTQDEYAKAIRGMYAGDIAARPSTVDQIEKEGREYFQTPLAHTGLTPDYLDQKWDEWRALKASQGMGGGATAGPASRPASQPSMAGQMQSSGLHGLTPEQWGGQQQTGMAGRVDAIQRQKQVDVSDLMSPDRTTKTAAAHRVRTTWFPQLPPTPDELMAMAAQQGVTGPTPPSPVDSKYQRADKLSLTPNASRPAPASVTSRPAPTTGGTRRMLPIEKR